MNIRTFRPGDEANQIAIYNEAAAPLSKFKPATLPEVARRCQARDFDPATRFFAEENGQAVGYATFHANGRVSFPWCRKGHASAAEPLFQGVLEAMRARGLASAFAAYRADWPAQQEFFLSRGFHLAREMVNFVLDLNAIPTRPSRRENPLTPLREEDIPAIFPFGQGVLRVQSPEELARYLFHNPYFQPEDLFVVRNRADEVPLAVGIVVANLTYADPHQVDALMPCFRTGAFGTEGMQTKRINGLFSFLTGDTRGMSPYTLELLGHAAAKIEEEATGTCLAAQVPSDAPHLVRFYNSYFRRQGSFPVLERSLANP